MPTYDELRLLQALPLDLKIRRTKQRIKEWVDAFGEDGVYVSFSGGKDSTVLLHIVRQLYPTIEAVFVDTGLEYPEIREYVKTFDNVTWLKPKMNFKKVIETYGYPFFGKETSDTVYYARRYLQSVNELNNIARQTDRQTDRQIIGSPHIADILDIDRRINKNNQDYLNLKKGIFPSRTIGKYEYSKLLNLPYTPLRLKILTGTLEHKEKGQIIDGEFSNTYNKKRYVFMLDAPFEISNKCCDVMKKRPAKEYQKRTGKMAMTAQMADESRLRTSQWLRNGCNGFSMKKPISNPMSFWTEQDVLQYIKQNNISICSVYGDIVSYYPDSDFEGQIGFDDLGVTDRNPLLKTTQCQRTGCMFCGFGCHLHNDNRFVSMKQTHPKQYEWIMKPTSEGGLGYKEVIDWINENGDFNIKY